jgi:hypothetical protein
VGQWEEQFLERPTINGCFIQSYIAAKAAQWGADQELEACCEWLQDPDLNVDTYKLRAARRPKPPTLQERALQLLERYDTSGLMLAADQVDTIRRALEALPND